ncbi:unnamed protein product [Urochloa humidicola]
MMPVAAAEDWSECAFSLTCEEDGADLGDGSVVDGDLFSPYNAGDDEEEEEYLEQLMFKETTSFCSSSESVSAADCDGDGDAWDADGEYQSVASEEWFRRARLAAVKWILETRGFFGFGHRTAYLAIAYFDSFLLRRRVDREAMPWAARLLSVACVSVAAKMEERQAPALSEFDAGDYDFCPASIRRMELLVLSTLGWRMAAVTPLDFLPCFASSSARTAAPAPSAAPPSRPSASSLPRHKVPVACLITGRPLLLQLQSWLQPTGRLC